MSTGGGERLRPLALVLASLLAAAPATGHGPARVEDEYIKGTFTPAFVPPSPGTYDLPVLGMVAPFVLRDAEGRSASTASVMSGKVAVVSFIYTACTDRLGCPLASAALRRLQTRLRDERLDGEAVLLTISFDTERDTPAQLTRYARAYDADPRLWRFMAAPTPRTLDALLKSYGQDRQPEYDEHGRFTGRYRHMLKVFLVDRRGRIRNIYSTGFLVPDVVVNDLKTVLRD